MTGTVIHFNSVKGYGFLSNSAGGPDIFCHYSELIQDGYKKLDKGDIVEGAIEDGPKGRPVAVRVVITGKAEV
jgi:CspA family cold shock protein